MPPYTLALDCGSTNFKAALFDGCLNRLAEAKLPLPSLEHSTGRVELDAEEIWQNTVALILQTCQLAGLNTSQVTRVSITSQAQTFLLVDGHGIPLTPLISWLDGRAEALVPQLQDALGSDFALHCSFSSPLKELQLTKLLWLRMYAPDFLDRAHQILPLPTWLALCLGGMAVIDTNIAAMSGLYSLLTNEYWREALELCGVQEAQLPALVMAGTPIRMVHACPDLKLSPQAVIILSGNDQTSGAYGNGCQAGVWVATLGTALVAYRLAGHTRGPYHPAGCWGPYPGGDFYELAVQSYGCAALDWAVDVLYPGQDIKAFILSAQSANEYPKSVGFTYSTDTTPTVRPLFFPDQMGKTSAWVGAGTQPERALSVLEGIGFELKRLIYEELGAGDGTHCNAKKLNVTGGGCQSDFWLQILADILAVPVQRGVGDSLLGAAWLASPGVEPPQSSPLSIWLPDPVKTAVYQDIYNQWRLCSQRVN